MHKIWKAIHKTDVSHSIQAYDKLIKTHAPGIKLIEVNQLKVAFYQRFKPVTVLKDITFDIYANEIIALLGANGAGKTTLINAIMGIIKHQGGTIIRHTDGQSVDEFIGAQFQDLKFPQGLNVRDMLEFEFNLSKQRIDEQELQTLLDTFKLTAYLKRPVSKLSGGQQQRLNVVLALITKPKIIFLDEFTTGLDIASKYEITEFIYKFCKANQITAVLISHDTEAINRLAERYLVIANQEIVVDAPKDVVNKWYGSIDNFLKYYIR